jgi:hypothetical protein
VLAERYSDWSGDGAEEWDHWVNGFDVNDYHYPADGSSAVIVGGLSEFRKDHKRQKAA